MSVALNLCCDETKNQGTYTRVTDLKTRREERPSARERERELALAPLFICFSVPGPARSVVCFT